MPAPNHQFSASLGAACALLALVGFSIAERSSAEAALTLNLDPEYTLPIVIQTHDGQPLDLSEFQLPSPKVAVSIFNENSLETLSLNLPSRVEELSDEDAAAISHHFRCKRTGRRRAMDPHLVEILVDLSENFQGRTITLISGFRAPPYGVPHSRHFRGKAMDLRVEGVDLKEVRDYLWQRHPKIGLGHYHGGDFLHVDYRPYDGKFAWEQRRPKRKYRYYPAWASL